MNADGSNRSVLFEDAEKSAVAPAWSPKGDRIAFGLGRFFQTLNGPAVADIAVIGADGKGLKVLTDGKGNNGFPSWSPDGRRLVYRSSDGKTSGLFILDVETGEVEGIEDRLDAATTSRPGRRPATSSPSPAIMDGDYELCTIKPDGTGFKRLTTFAGQRRPLRLVARRQVDRLRQRPRRVQGRGPAAPVQRPAVRQDLRHAGRRLGRPPVDRRRVRARHGGLRPAPGSQVGTPVSCPASLIETSRDPRIASLATQA